MRSGAVPRVRPREITPVSGQAHQLGSDAPESQAPESQAPESQAPESQAPDVEVNSSPVDQPDEDDDVETVVNSQDWTPGIFDEEPFPVNNDNDGHRWTYQLHPNDDPDLVNCVHAMTKLNDMKDIAANWNIELDDHKYIKDLKNDIDDFIMLITIKITAFEVTMGKEC